MVPPHPSRGGWGTERLSNSGMVTIHDAGGTRSRRSDLSTIGTVGQRRGACASLRVGCLRPTPFLACVHLARAEGSHPLSACELPNLGTRQSGSRLMFRARTPGGQAHILVEDTCHSLYVSSPWILISCAEPPRPIWAG
jgi:hypothetical protein